MANGTEATAVGAPRRSADLLAVAVLFLLITIAFRDVWTEGSCFFVRDLTRFYFPTKRILHDVVRGGEFPLWNRFYSGGQPAAANPESELFYPGQWPIFVRDYFFGFRLHILLHFYIAALAMYSLMRSLRTGIAAATFTAVVFVFGGPLLSVVNLLPVLFCAAWMPFTFLWSRRFLLERKTRDFVLAALFFGLQALAFEPSVLLETVAAVGAYAVFAGTSSRSRIVNLALVTSLFGCGSLVAAAQVIPTLELFRTTSRATGLTFDQISYWSMPPLRLGELLQPRFAGHSPFLTADFWGGVRYRQATAPFLQTLYLGLAALVALVTGLLRRNRLAILACSGAAVCWLVAFGEHTPLLRMLVEAGVPMPLRFPERFAFAAGISLTIGAGLMIDRVIVDAAWRAVAARVAGVLAASLTAFALFTFSGAYVRLFVALWGAAGATLLPHWIALSRIDWLLAAGRAIALLVILLLLRSRQRGLAIALLIFTGADLLEYTHEIAPRETRRYFEEPAEASGLRKPSGDYRLFIEPEWSGGATAKRYFGNKPTLYWTTRNALLPRIPAAWGLQTIFERDVDLTNIRASNELVDAMWNVRRSGRPDWAEAFMAMGNVGYRAAYRPFGEETARHPDPRDVRPLIFVPVAETPRYYFADEIVAVRSTDDFTRKMIVERHSLRAAYVAMTPFPPAVGKVESVEESTNGAVLRVSAPARAFLVASVTAHRNWEATIDGMPAAIRPANVAFQGIDVPPGSHTIVFRYRDPAVTAGIVISLLALVAAVVVWRAFPPGAAAPAKPFP